MIRAENYETVTTFVKVMPRILWPLFSRLVYKVPMAKKDGVHTVQQNQ